MHTQVRFIPVRCLSVRQPMIRKDVCNPTSLRRKTTLAPHVINNLTVCSHWHPPSYRQDTIGHSGNASSASIIIFWLLKAKRRAFARRFCFISVMAGLCPGHPRLSYLDAAKTWMPGTKAGHDEEKSATVILRCEPCGALAPRGEPRRMGNSRTRRPSRAAEEAATSG
jgi:hypothetical protein